MIWWLQRLYTIPNDKTSNLMHIERLMYLDINIKNYLTLNCNMVLQINSIKCTKLLSKHCNHMSMTYWYTMINSHAHDSTNKACPLCHSMTVIILHLQLLTLEELRLLDWKTSYTIAQISLHEQRMIVSIRHYLTSLLHWNASVW